MIQKQRTKIKRRKTKAKQNKQKTKTKSKNKKNLAVFRIVSLSMRRLGTTAAAKGVL